MTSNLPFDPPQRNPKTYRLHRKEVLWQITVPIVSMLVILLLVALLSTQLSKLDTRMWSNISAIWLIIPMIFLSVIFLVIQIASTYLIIRFVQILPLYSNQAYLQLLKLGFRIDLIGRRIVEPFIRVRTFRASTRALGTAFRKRNQ